MMYQEIGKRPPVYHLYKQKLISEGVLTEEEVNQNWTHCLSKISEAYAQSLKSTFDISKWRSQTYHRVIDYSKLGEIKKTGLSN